MRRQAGAFLALLLVSTGALAQAPEEIIDRIDKGDAALRAIMDERDRLYTERDKARGEAVAAALASAEKAVAKAEDAANKRFDSVNEFRATLTDQAARFISKAEVDARLKAIEERIAELSVRQQAILSEARGASELWTLIAGGLVLLMTLGGFGLAIIRRPAKP